MKCDESEIFQVLNENLKNKLQMHLRGKIIGQMHLNSFGLDFLSILTQKHLTRVTYVLDDFIFMEKDKAEMQYFII